MKRLVECVPNFSEGRDQAKIDLIVAALESVPGVKLLDRQTNTDHNRAVLTLVGEPRDLAEAAFRGVARAADLIDMRQHRGQHPRMGATDVVPFVPIRGVEMADCVELARDLGRRVGEQLGIPVFLYEEAASRPERRNLANIRAGEFEGLLSLVGTDKSREPDYGPIHLHPTAGAVAIGARRPLVAFNVNLNTTDVAIAKAIARAVRHVSGGLRYVKALGLELKETGQTQISMNLTNTDATPIQRVFALIKAEADRHGVSICQSEIVGLVPMDALLDVAEHHLRLNSFSRSQVLERRLLEWDDDGQGSSV